MNPYEARKLAKMIHKDRAKRIETLLIRLAANGDLHPAPDYDHLNVSWHEIRQEAERVIELANDRDYSGGQDLAEMILSALRVKQ